MSNWIKVIANKWWFKDSEQEVDLDSLVKGEGITSLPAAVDLATPKVDIIAEKTPATGVTVDGILLKDNLDTSGIVGKTTTQTLTNKRNTKRAYTTTSLATLTPEIATYDMFSLTAQAEALNIANHSTSTPNAGDCILINITPDATPRALTYGNNYVAYSGVALPSTTIASKRIQLLFIWLPVGKYSIVWAGQEV